MVETRRAVFNRSVCECERICLRWSFLPVSKRGAAAAGADRGRLPGVSRDATAFRVLL